MRWLFWILAVLLELGIYDVPAQTNGIPLVQRQWFETRTAHFNIYSCGAPQDVNKVSGQLEEFCEAFYAAGRGAGSRFAADCRDGFSRPRER